MRNDRALKIDSKGTNRWRLGLFLIQERNECFHLKTSNLGLEKQVEKFYSTLILSFLQKCIAVGLMRLGLSTIVIVFTREGWTGKLASVLSTNLYRHRNHAFCSVSIELRRVLLFLAKCKQDSIQCSFRFFVCRHQNAWLWQRTLAIGIRNTVWPVSSWTELDLTKQENILVFVCTETRRPPVGTLIFLPMVSALWLQCLLLLSPDLYRVKGKRRRVE